MKGKWRVTHQTCDGAAIYQVYRLRDVNSVDHSGNREYADYIYDEERAAQLLADHLNGGDKNA